MSSIFDRINNSTIICMSDRDGEVIKPNSFLSKILSKKDRKC